jgi:hypothetical protein
MDRDPRRGFELAQSIDFICMRWQGNHSSSSQQKLVLILMRFIYETQHFSPPRTDCQDSKYLRNRNFSKVSTLVIGSDLLFFVGASQSANSGNAQHLPRPSIGLWLVPIPTPPSQGKRSRHAHTLQALCRRNTWRPARGD